MPLGEREAELRRRNEDVDRRRVEALRLAGDVVRHQEVRVCTITYTSYVQSKGRGIAWRCERVVCLCVRERVCVRV